MDRRHGAKGDDRIWPWHRGWMRLERLKDEENKVIQAAIGGGVLLFISPLCEMWVGSIGRCDGQVLHAIVPTLLETEREMTSFPPSTSSGNLTLFSFPSSPPSASRHAFRSVPDTTLHPTFYHTLQLPTTLGHYQRSSCARQRVSFLPSSPLVKTAHYKLLSPLSTRQPSTRPRDSDHV